MSYKHIEGIRVEIDDLVYMPSLPSPDDKPHPFVYFISIHNDSKEEIQILGRKWIVDEVNNGLLIVEGNGVVGEKPTLPPGDSFSYNSCHIVAGNAEVTGAFFGKTASGELFTVQIPEFKLETP